ncbi:type IV pilin protein [uncultured Tolumonas sp.]|uniref:type IV pilin protein n=1 Tax=uncultured Tolumonas sp. TaxID=263765 RepID=UPI002A0A36BA|nr:type IV pilin protein [uncultured Tolumonas sp.]
MRKLAGITLIELMIAVAIVAVLAGVAYPSYMRHILTSHRTEASSTLIRLANLEERYYLDNNQYGSLFQLGLTATSAATYTTTNGYYTITIATPTTSTYTLTATASGTQASDSDCVTYTLTQNGTKTSSSSSSCWN